MYTCTEPEYSYCTDANESPGGVGIGLISFMYQCTYLLRINKLQKGSPYIGFVVVNLVSVLHIYVPRSYLMMMCSIRLHFSLLFVVRDSRDVECFPKVRS